MSADDPTYFLPLICSGHVYDGVPQLPMNTLACGLLLRRSSTAEEWSRRTRKLPAKVVMQCTCVKECFVSSSASPSASGPSTAVPLCRESKGPENATDQLGRARSGEAVSRTMQEQPARAA